MILKINQKISNNFLKKIEKNIKKKIKQNSKNFKQKLMN